MSAAPKSGGRRSAPRGLAAAVLLLAAALGSTACAAQPQRIASDPTNGFAIYRTGRLTPPELAELCRLGVEEIVVLSGTGRRRECRFREGRCPDLRVRYDTGQEAGEPLTGEFLAAFDQWVEEARSEGKKIAFRCFHGWHRTGRLAAYYRMRFEGWSADDSRAEMHRIGDFMWRHPYLDPQVVALRDFTEGRACSTASEHCVGSAEGDPSIVDGRFADDLCP